MSSLIDTVSVTTTLTKVKPDETYIRYIGFSSQSPTPAQTGFRLYDIDLIKQDLLNFFAIRKGSKLMNPSFGTRIWDLLYEPFTEATQQAIVDDVTAGVKNDLRISASDLRIYPNKDQSSITVSLSLTVLPSNQSSTMLMTFDPVTGIVSQG